MTTEAQQLVRETIELTGSAAPSLMDAQAPVLAGDALAGSGDGFYLVGLIGGKDVGKSSIVNALAGRDITAITSYGPGTESIIAYAHREQERALRAMLDREAAGQFRIVTHDIAQMRRQVLLDLPDIDSHYESHVQLTRRMLRHMLYPIWIQSVEKYADRTPQKMLAAVAEGNAPANFVFCLNKVDQIASREAMSDLADDFSRRLASLLKIDAPRVHLISAQQPEKFDLPSLRETISRDRTSSAIQTSKDLAIDQQDRSLIVWLDAQDLPARLDRLKHLEQDAAELLTARIGGPLLEQAVPNLLDDPGHRLALIDRATADRVARWPIVNLVHTLFSPVLSLVQTNVAPAAGGVEGLVDSQIGPRAVDVSQLVQSSFAQLRQSNASAQELYRHRKLWDDAPADAAAADLRSRLAGTLRRQRETIGRSTRGTLTAVNLPIRWLLTIGAVIWFPFAQPILEVVLQKQITGTVRETGLLLVQIFSAAYLLKNLAFLAGYFVILWLMLRWDTQRRVARKLARWRTAETDDASLSLATQAIGWIDDLLDPVTAAREKFAGIAERVENFRRGRG